KARRKWFGKVILQLPSVYLVQSVEHHHNPLGWNRSHVSPKRRHQPFPINGRFAFFAQAPRQLLNHVAQKDLFIERARSGREKAVNEGPGPLRDQRCHDCTLSKTDRRGHQQITALFPAYELLDLRDFSPPPDEDLGEPLNVLVE